MPFLTGLGSTETAPCGRKTRSPAGAASGTFLARGDHDGTVGNCRCISPEGAERFVADPAVVRPLLDRHLDEEAVHHLAKAWHGMAYLVEAVAGMSDTIIFGPTRLSAPQPEPSAHLVGPELGGPRSVGMATQGLGGGDIEVVGEAGTGVVVDQLPQRAGVSSGVEYSFEDHLVSVGEGERGGVDDDSGAMPFDAPLSCSLRITRRR